MEGSLIENQNVAFDPQIDSKLAFVNVVDSHVDEPKKNLFPLIKSNQSNNMVPISAQTYTGNTLYFVENNISPDFTIARDAYVTGVANVNVAVTNLTALTTDVRVGATYPLIQGFTFAPCADPFSEMVNSCIPTVNDVQVGTYYMQEQKSLMLELSQNKRNQELKALPYADDMVANYNNAYLTNYNNLASGLDSNPQSGFIPNGTYPLQYSNDSGATWSNSPQPYIAPGANAGIPINTVTNYFKIRMPFKASVTGIAPFSWNDAEEGDENGLRGVRKFTLTFNLASGTRLLRNLSNVKCGLDNSAFSITCSLDPNNPFFGQPILYYQLISPPATFSLDRQPLNIVPILRVERALSKRQGGPAVAPSAGGIITDLSAVKLMSTDNITLSKVPELIAVYACPVKTIAGYTNNYADFFYALNDAQGCINIMWNNQLVCANLSKYDLYRMYRKNGGQQSWLVWSGQVCQNPSLSSTNVLSANILNMRGGMILLKPGIDFPIGMGLSPNGPCDLKFQVTLNVQNQTLIDGSGDTSSALYVWCLYNDFLVNDTIEAKTKVVTNIITPEGVLSADRKGEAVPHDEVQGQSNMVGGSFMHRFKRMYRGLKHRKQQHHDGGVMTAGAMSGGVVAEPKKKASARAH
jgi:hypothetical protein